MWNTARKERVEYSLRAYITETLFTRFNIHLKYSLDVVLTAWYLNLAKGFTSLTKGILVLSVIAD